MTAAPRTPARPLSVERRHALGRRAQLLAGASVAYNLVEAVLSVAAGAAASSIALIGFGLDSLIEVGSGLVILWQFQHPLPETREKRALRLIALSYFALAAYVTVQSARSLLGVGEAAPSRLGIGIAVASVIVMPFLSWAQRRTGRALGSGSVVADSKQTLLCTYLSAVLLVGLVANATLGWTWVDPIAALVIAAVAVREGLEAWRGDACGCVPTSADTRATSADDSDEGSDQCAQGCADHCAGAQPPTAAELPTIDLPPGSRTAPPPGANR